MKKILMTGSTGFVGHNVLPILKQKNDYEFITPRRNDLNLKDEQEIVTFLKHNDIDTIIHFANPTPSKNKLDSFETLTDDSLRIFLNFYNHSDLFNKMIYTGSGAEFDKTKDISLVQEIDELRSIPKDSYGLSKMIMNILAEKSNNVYNFRIFGCYGPDDAATKFITHCIRSVILNKEITIRKDCYFDYLHVFDFAKYINWGMNTDLKHHSYNVSSGRQFLLSEIAKLVLEEMNSKLEVRLLSEERNLDYSASNDRIVNESHIQPEFSIVQGIKKQIEWEIENFNENTCFDGK